MFVEVNCVILCGDIVMLMLFGYVKGVFIGVWEFCEGLLCSVNGGMLFFDEIGELGVDE